MHSVQNDSQRTQRPGGDEVRLRQALRERPTNVGALNDLGSLLSSRGDSIEAIRVLAQSIAWNPNSLDAYGAIVKLYYELGRSTEAVGLYEEWLRRDPENVSVRHFLAAISGMGVPVRASQAYVRGLFDSIASTFDETLVTQLAYRGPEIIASALACYAEVGRPLKEVLDAGCGTGLCGPLIRKKCERLIGVDISQNMIAEARRRQVYDELVVDDLCTFMQGRPNSYDAIVFCDVLIYFGALDSVVVAASSALRSGGLLLFTVEALLDMGQELYRLGAHGRYMHRATYLADVLLHAGLDLRGLSRETLRQELQQGVPTYVVAAQNGKATHVRG